MQPVSQFSEIQLQINQKRAEISELEKKIREYTQNLIQDLTQEETKEIREKIKASIALKENLIGIITVLEDDANLTCPTIKIEKFDYSALRKKHTSLNKECLHVPQRNMRISYDPQCKSLVVTFKKALKNCTITAITDGLPFEIPGQSTGRLYMGAVVSKNSESSPEINACRVNGFNWRYTSNGVTANRFDKLEVMWINTDICENGTVVWEGPNPDLSQ